MGTISSIRVGFDSSPSAGNSKFAAEYQTDYF